MTRPLLTTLSLLCLSIPAQTPAQTPRRALDHLNLQVHGYAAQGLAYTTHNNWSLMDSTSVSPDWTDAVLNLSWQPKARLRLGAQGRYFHLGGVQNKVTLDWAQADFKLNETLGFRGGKVKTPVALLNESQDIDPAQLWVLLPQSVYPIASRNSILTHNGGVVYGTIPLGESFGKLEYRAFGGQRSLSGDDGYLQSTRDDGFAIPNGVSGHVSGGSLHWKTPARGVIFGASVSSGNLHGALTYGPYPGELTLPSYNQLYYFGRLERGAFLLAGEYTRVPLRLSISVAGYPTDYRSDERGFYAMASYKPARRLTTGLYYSSYLDRQARYTNLRYQKDWALSGRYDFNSWLYAKLEQHFVDGNAIGISTSDNTHLQPDNRMTLAKVGVSF